MDVKDSFNRLMAEVKLEDIENLDHDLTRITPLATAALSCNVANLEIILNSTERETINFFSGSKRQLTPLQWCLTSDPPSNMDKCVKLLVEAGADVNLKEPWDGQSAVHIAAEMDLPVILMLLMDNGGDVNVPDWKRNLPLHYICQNPETTESLKCYRRLVIETSITNAQSETLLSIAAKGGTCQIVHNLDDSGCVTNVNRKDRNRTTLLMESVKERDVELSKILLNLHGADVNDQDQFGNSVIDYCFSYNRENPMSAKDALEIILQFKPQINIVKLAEKYLHTIVLYGDLETLKFFVAEGFDINHIGQTDENIFHFLARVGRKLQKFDTLCDKCRVDHKDAYGNTPLMATARQPSHINIEAKLKYFLKRGADVNSVDNNGRTALMMCAAHKPNAIKLLLEAGPDVNIVDNDGNTALMFCVTHTPDVMKLLLDAGADVNIVNNEGTTVLMKCAEHTPDVMKLLLDAGADVNMVDNTGYTALMSCASHTPGVIKLLLDAGADVNVVDSESRTALMFCATHNPDATKLLLDAGADVNKVDNEGTTALMMCAIYYPDVIKLLLDAGADVSIVNHKGTTALMTCAIYYPDVIKLLLNAGADVNIVNNEGTTALMMCVKYNHDVNDVTKLLLDAGADVDIVDNEGTTALMLCAKHNPDVMKLLLDAGADVNIFNNEGRTALTFCAEYCPRDIKILLDAGGDLSIKDKKNHTALYYLNTQYLNLYFYFLKLCLQYENAMLLDIKTSSGFTPLQYVLDTGLFSLLWHILAENCSLESLKKPYPYPPSPPEMVVLTRNRRVKFGKILYLCGAKKERIEEEFCFKSNDEKRFHTYCNNVSLKQLCRRRLRNSIGAGIQQKLSKECQIPVLLYDFIIMKDIFLENVFDPNEISDSYDKANIFEGVTLDDVGDDDDYGDDDYSESFSFLPIISNE